MVDFTTCSTGVAGGSPNQFFCDLDTTPGSVPNGAGSLCYESFDSCNSGPNACGTDTVPCEYQFGVCATGVAAGVAHKCAPACCAEAVQVAVACAPLARWLAVGTSDGLPACVCGDGPQLVLHAGHAAGSASHGIWKLLLRVVAGVPAGAERLLAVVPVPADAGDLLNGHRWRESQA